MLQWGSDDMGLQKQNDVLGKTRARSPARKFSWAGIAHARHHASRSSDVPISTRQGI
jgi:hypothetical protein